MRSQKLSSPLTVCAVFCACALAGLSFTQAGLIIDPFSDSQSLAVNKTNPTDSGSVTGSSVILGGTRDALLHWETNPGKNAYLDVNYDDSGVLDFIQDPRVQSQLTLTWNGPDDSPWDLTAGGNDSLAIDVLFDDMPINLEISIYSGASDVSQATISLPGNIFSSTTEKVFFSAFSGTASFANVREIKMQINGTGSATSADLTLDNFRASVPEPATLVMLGITAILGLGMWRWRK